MENANPPPLFKNHSQKLPNTTHSELTLRIKKASKNKGELGAYTFFGCFNYVVDFMILEDIGCVIDSRLSEVVLGKPFVETSKLNYDQPLGLISFAHEDDEVVFRMPQRTQELQLISPLEKDKFEAFFMESLKVRKKGFKHVLEKRKGYYKACMNLGHEYKKDK
ncbi:hypothetical protein Tco_1171039 [Tanacetum coccineum]